MLSSDSSSSMCLIHNTLPVTPTMPLNLSLVLCGRSLVMRCQRSQKRHCSSGALASMCMARPDWCGGYSAPQKKQGETLDIIILPNFHLFTSSLLSRWTPDALFRALAITCHSPLVFTDLKWLAETPQASRCDLQCTLPFCDPSLVFWHSEVSLAHFTLSFIRPRNRPFLQEAWPLEPRSGT